ncbi:NADH-quinone oxidoreductase subunit N [Bdellovibrionota bacterium]
MFPDFSLLQLDASIFGKMSFVLIPLITACAILLIEVFFPREEKLFSALLSFWGLLLAFFAVTRWWNEPTEYLFQGGFVLDRFTLFFAGLFILVAALTILISVRYIKREGMHYGEYYFLTLATISGMMLLAASADLVMVFLAIEVMSIGAYILTGINRERMRPTEGALKYFLLGAFASGILLYGIALIYGATGSTSFLAIKEFLAAGSSVNLLFWCGLVLIFVGFGFKIAAVPFHLWAPDAYEGAPTPITAFMATGVKAAALAAFFRFMVHAVPSLTVDWVPILWWGAVITMTVGNVAAMVQQNIKRMLAYSSVAHAGYLLTAFVALGGPAGTLAGEALLYYLLAYTVMTFCAFTVVILVAKQGDERVNVDDYTGLGRQHPVLAVVMTIALLSLAGFPPTAGFFGKFYLFSAVVQSGFAGLAVIGVLNSVLSVYYYLRPVVNMYMKIEGAPEVSFEKSLTLGIALVVTTYGIFHIGIFSSPFLNIAKQTMALFGG